MNLKKKLSIWAVVIVLLLGLGFASIPQPVNARLNLNTEFAPSAVTYTNKTFHFQDTDPYDGYSYWTYDVGTTTNIQNGNKYAMNTDANGECAYFGFDEFVNHSIVSSQTIFETSLLVGTYHFQPLGYFYQKTALESNTHWALVIDWDSTGIDLYYNTGNGGTPTSVNLDDTAPEVGTIYNITLSNLGDQTYVYIQDIFGTEQPVIYSGYTTTETYDATALYAGFGQYSSGDGNIYGWHDDFTIFDSTFTYGADGTGFSKINAYVDTVFTQTLYDMDGEDDPSLETTDSVTNVTLLVECWLNSTTYGISTLAEGKNIIRHNITVTSTNDTIVFSQANLTYIRSADYDDKVFWYQYSVELDFTIMPDQIYTVVISYEIFYPVE